MQDYSLIERHLSTMSKGQADQHHGDTSKPVRDVGNYRFDPGSVQRNDHQPSACTPHPDEERLDAGGQVGGDDRAYKPVQAGQAVDRCTR